MCVSSAHHFQQPLPHTHHGEGVEVASTPASTVASSGLFTLSQSALAHWQYFVYRDLDSEVFIMSIWRLPIHREV